MVVNQIPFTVTVDPHGTNVDITEFVTSIDECKFQATGKIRTASIMLEALEGAFITNTNAGTTPQMNEFTKIQIEWQDLNEVTKAAIFEVDVELGQKDSSGVLLPLELKGRERALQDIKTTCYFEFVNPLFMINFLVVSYNARHGTNQPNIDTVAFVNTEPLASVTMVFDFTSGWTYYDALMHVIERLNAPTSSGGVGNFYSLILEDEPLNNNLKLTVKEQGTGGTTGTIQSVVTDPMHELSYRIDATKATQVYVRGMPNAGSVPNGFHDFSSVVEEVNNLPLYISTATYLPPQLIMDNGVIFEAIAPVPTSTPPPNVSFWVSRTFAQIAGSIEYSEWTNDKALQTKNSCSNPTAAFITSGFDAPAFPDGNLVVRETFYFRDFVHIRSIDDTQIFLDATNKFYLRGQAQTGLYRGFRILVDTSLGAPDGSFGDGVSTVFTDRFNRGFGDALVQYTGTEWIVIKEKEDIDPLDKNVMHCCVLSEGKIYEYNKVNLTGAGRLKLAIRKADVFRGGTGATFGWIDLSDGSANNDAFHHPKNIETVTGLLTPEIKANQTIAPYLINSAIKITYEFTPAQAIIDVVNRIGNFFQTVADTIFNIFDDPIEDTVAPTSTELTALAASSFYDIGWWYALPFPYPVSEFNAIPEQVGDLYGLGTDANNINNEFFGTLDIQNSTFSHQGKFGLGHDQTDDMGGPFTGLAFYQAFNIIVGASPQPFKGDIPFTITVYDDLSQVWRADYQYRHMGDAQEILLPFSAFTVNRPSRNPWSIDTLLINLIHTPELEIRSIFQERRVRLITWQLKTSYDDDERYMPFNTDNFITAVFAPGTFSFEGTIDGLRLTKQPFVSSGVETTRVINPDTVEATNTRNKRQLISIATAEKQKQGHKFEAYNYTTDIRCDLLTEQSMFLEDADMIKFADRGESSPGASDGDPNTRKLVMLEQNFTYNANGTHSGALVDFTMVKRIPV